MLTPSHKIEKRREFIRYSAFLALFALIHVVLHCFDGYSFISTSFHSVFTHYDLFQRLLTDFIEKQIHFYNRTYLTA